VKSLVNISHVDLGLRPENVVMFRVAPLLNGYFLPYRQSEAGFMTYDVRTAMQPDAFMVNVRKHVTKLDPNLPVDDVRTLAQQIEESVFIDRFISVLSLPSPHSRPCSPRLGFTACSPTPSRSGRRKSGYGWRSAPSRAWCAGWSSHKWPK
jgi:hypothetical protein